MSEAKEKLKRYKAAAFLSRGMGDMGTGIKMAGETVSSSNVVGAKSTPMPGAIRGVAGLPMGTPVTQLSSSSSSGYIPPKSTKRNATSPLADLLQTVRKAVRNLSPSNKTMSTPYHTPYRGVFIDEDGTTRVANMEGQVQHSAMLAHVIGTPIPVFDPDREVIDRVHTENTKAAINIEQSDQPVTNASLAAVNRALLSEFSANITNMVKAELQTRDAYMNEVALKAADIMRLAYAVSRIRSAYC